MSAVAADKDFAQAQNVRLVIYRLQSNGSYKAVYSGSLGSNPNAWITRNLVTGNYVAMVQRSGSQNTNYALTISGRQLENASELDNDYANARDLSFFGGQAMETDYVGFADAGDMFRLAVDDFGSYDFRLQAGDSSRYAAGASLKLWVHEDGKYRQLAAGKLNAKTGRVEFNDVVLSDNGEYFVQVLAGGSNDRNAVNYTLTVDLDHKISGRDPENNSWGNASAVTAVEKNGETVAFEGSGWVGLEDNVDWFKFTTDAAGKYSLGFGAAGSKAAFEVYEAAGDGRRILSLSSANATSLNAWRDLNLKAGTDYYVKVSVSTDNGSLNSDYDFKIVRNGLLA